MKGVDVIGRTQFLRALELPKHFLQIMKGVDVIGRTQFLRALGLPEHFLPDSLKRIIQGIQAPDKCEGRLIIIMQLSKLKAD